MSRSRKKTPISGVAACSHHSSEKWDKQKANRKLRHRCKEALRREAEVLPELREVSNVWGFYKDGKHWYGTRENESKPWYKKMFRK